MRGILIHSSKQELIELKVNQNRSLFEKYLRNPATQILKKTFSLKIFFRIALFQSLVKSKTKKRCTIRLLTFKEKKIWVKNVKYSKNR